MIPLSVPSIEGNEWKYVKECLDTGWVSSAGKFVDRFEDEIKRFTGSKFAIACVNGTSALHISLILAGVNQGDEVLVPTVTFIAPINAVRYVGAEPVFFDCDDYYNMDISKLARFLEEETVRKDGFTFNKKTGRRIAAVIPVHVFGSAVLMDDLVGLGEEYNIKIIEDATESLGTVYVSGRYAGKHTGTIGEFGCLSFNGNKIITTGGGGMILTNNEEFAQKAKYLTTQAKDDTMRYIHHEIGYNYRLTNVQAAIGVAQLEQLPKYLEIKKQNYQRYQEKLTGSKGLTLAPVPEYASNNHWLYALQFDPEEYGKSKEELLDLLNRNGIQARPLWYLNHWQRPYQNCQSYQVEKAVKLFETTINIPSSVSLTEEQIDKVVEVLLNG